MLRLRVIVAFIAGVGLYYVAVVLAGGMLAAMPVPRSYFVFFGQEHNELALAVLSFFGWALPVAALVTGGTLAISRLLQSHGQSVWGPALAGMSLCFVYGALVSAGFLSPQEHPRGGFSQAVLAAVKVPWWAAANVLAPWFGFALAVRLMFRTTRPQ